MNGPPGNGEGPRGSGPTLKLTGLTDNNSISVFARLCRLIAAQADELFVLACGHSGTRIERMPEGYKHYACEICATCGRHIRWVAKPQTLARRKLTAYRLARLAMCSSLSAWERSFVRDVSQRRNLSPRQQEVVDGLCATYLEEAA